MLRDNKVSEEILKNAYRSHCASLSQTRLQITLILAIILIIFFGALDYVVYPKMAMTMLITRLFIGAFLMAIFFALKRKKFLSSNSIGIAVVSAIFLLINFLIFITEGMSSPYYAGLILALVAFSAMLPWGAHQTLLSFFIMLCSYVVASFMHPYTNDLQYNFPILINNLFFLISVGIFCIISTYLNNKLRLREFSLNYNLDSSLKNETLKLRSTQAQLVHSEKINAIGNLSAGLLHEVNNPLNYTMTALQVMKMDPHINSDPDLKDTMKDIEEGMSRIKHIVTDLRAFAYPEEADKKNQFAILSAIESALRFTAHDCKDIERIVDVDPALIVSASKTHIVQVLINLISNATKAINKTTKKGLIHIEAKQQNNRISISVSDNGTGMKEETLSRVFDPFFTTNEVGKGMGLGLSVSHTIIKNHGGNLFATSELGEGSKFYFDLGI